MDGTPLITDRELASSAFSQDLRSFSILPAEVLLAVAEIGDSQDGFYGNRQTHALSENFGIPHSTAAGVLRIADHFYVRAGSLGITAADAADQIVLAANRMGDSVEVDDIQRGAIETVLSFKRDYEMTLAAGRIMSKGPHFIGSTASWSVGQSRISNGETVSVPILSVSITWHDGVGNNHEAFFQMDDRDLGVLAELLKEIADSRQNI